MRAGVVAVVVVVPPAVVLAVVDVAPAVVTVEAAEGVVQTTAKPVTGRHRVCLCKYRPVIQVAAARYLVFWQWPYSGRMHALFQSKSR